LKKIKRYDQTCKTESPANTGLFYFMSRYILYPIHGAGIWFCVAGCFFFFFVIYFILAGYLSFKKMK